MYTSAEFAACPQTGNVFAILADNSGLSVDFESTHGVAKLNPIGQQASKQRVVVKLTEVQASRVKQR